MVWAQRIGQESTKNIFHYFSVAHGPDSITGTHPSFFRLSILENITKAKEHQNFGALLLL